jgi:hypothetical protein
MIILVRDDPVFGSAQRDAGNLGKIAAAGGLS